MSIAGKIDEVGAKLDHIGKPAWIGLIVASFFVFWPLGLAVLAYFIGSGRMACWTKGGAGRWHNTERSQTWWGGRGGSGNRAFDDYRTETLRRLEEEEREFREFLDRLRHAKDKAEFDQFMAERGRRDGQAQPQT